MKPRPPLAVSLRRRLARQLAYWQRQRAEADEEPDPVLTRIGIKPMSSAERARRILVADQVIRTLHSILAEISIAEAEAGHAPAMPRARRAR